MDWKREYRLSDLFRRKAKSEPWAPAVEPPTPTVEPGEAVAEEQKQSVMKKEIHLFGRRKAKNDEPVETESPDAVGEPEVEASATGPVALPVPSTPVADPPTPTVEPGEAVAEEQKQSVMKKEIHLFGRRKAKNDEPVETESPDAVGEPEVEASATGPVALPVPSTPVAEPLTPAVEPGEAVAEEQKQSVMKKEIHLFGRRKAKNDEPVETESPDAVGEPEVEASAAAPAVNEPESVEIDRPSATEAGGAEWEPDQTPASEPPGAAATAATLAAAEAGSELISDDQPVDAEAEPDSVPLDQPGESDSSAESDPAGPRRRGFGRRSSRSAAEKSEPGGPDRRETPSRRERSTDDRATRSEARGGKPTALPDVPLFRAINLLPREEAKARRQGPSLQQVAVAVIGLVMLGMLSFVFVLQRARVQDREAEVQRLQADIAEIATPDGAEAPDSTAEVAGELITRAGTLSIVLDGRIVWDRLLRQLSLVLPPDVWFDGITSSVSTSSSTTDATSSTTDAARTSLLTIKGYARTQQGVAELLGRLEVVPEFELVQLQSGELVDLGEEKVVQFTVTATLKPEGGVAS